MFGSYDCGKTRWLSADGSAGTTHAFYRWTAQHFTFAFMSGQTFTSCHRGGTAWLAGAPETTELSPRIFYTQHLAHPTAHTAHTTPPPRTAVNTHILHTRVALTLRAAIHYTDWRTPPSNSGCCGDV